jgi:hypothetical protein
MLLGLRELAGALGRQVERTLPEYTDHSVRHMDALWTVANQVLSSQECKSVTPSEALILGACFYVHDLGMAFAATAEGVANLKKNKQYKPIYDRLRNVYKLPPNRAEVLAVRLTTREVHARKAPDLCSEPLPGVGRFLIESAEARERWAYLIGHVAASHHWDLDEVHRQLGSRNSVPTADGSTADLGFLACVLRIIDYAHINRERASNLDRALRSEISADSVVHWDAQASVTGPVRENDLLVYGCTTPIQDIDAWWLFYDLASGLDAEIRNVREYLRGRAVSANRFSLQGVKGIELPQTFTTLVQLAGDTAPIDIRVQPHSMERLVDLLGGKRLYGLDHLAPLRELIQNARDAIELRKAAEQVDNRTVTAGEIIVALDDVDEKSILSVRDNGVGMGRSVIVRYLIAVGSDFWHSAEFYRDFGKVLDFGFRPIGKFGIGFLSVFMFGDYVEVETETAGSDRTLLRLRGLGRRGELKEMPATGDIGTEVRITLKPEIAERLADLVPIVRARAPMLQIPLTVRTRRGGSRINEQIESGWWKQVEDESFCAFVRDWETIGRSGRGPVQDEASIKRQRWLYNYESRPTFGESMKGWPTTPPTVIEEGMRVMSRGGLENYGVVQCSQGIAVDVVNVKDVTGVVEIGEVELTTARGAIIPSEYESQASWDNVGKAMNAGVVRRIRLRLLPEIVSKLNDLERYGMLPARLNFLRGLSAIYGNSLLRETTLRWIPVLEPPGNLVHRSRREFQEQLRQQSHLLLTVGAGPAAAYLTTPHIALSQLAQILVVAIWLKEFDVGYDRRQQLKFEESGTVLRGALDELIDRTRASRSSLVLTQALIAEVEEAWSIPNGTVEKQRWGLDFEKDILWVDLARDEMRGKRKLRKKKRR